MEFCLTVSLLIWSHYEMPSEAVLIIIFNFTFPINAISLIQTNFHEWPLVTVLTGFHCIQKFFQIALTQRLNVSLVINIVEYHFL